MSRLIVSKIEKYCCIHGRQQSGGKWEYLPLRNTEKKNYVHSSYSRLNPPALVLNMAIWLASADGEEKSLDILDEIRKWVIEIIRDSLAPRRNVSAFSPSRYYHSMCTNEIKSIILLKASISIEGRIYQEVKVLKKRPCQWYNGVEYILI